MTSQSSLRDGPSIRLMMKLYLGCVGGEAGMVWIFVWTEILDRIACDSIMHFGRSTSNAFFVRERDPPGS